MSDDCVVCEKRVTNRQHAVSCDKCERWQHRLCDTGISRDEYNKMRKGETDIQFTCNNCQAQLHSTVIETSFSSSGIRDDITFALDLSLRDETNESDSTEPETTDPFDVTRGEPTEPTIITERNIGETPLSDTILCDEEVTYEVIEEGTERKRRKLVSSDGYSYCVKLRQSSLNDVHAPSGLLVRGKMTDMFTTSEFNLPKPKSLARNVQRNRKKCRPADPKDLEFEVDTDFLDNKSFLIGDVRVGTERHLLFGTDWQMSTLQMARRWYLDGTFKIVPKPFAQMWSIHAFVKQNDCTKQISLLFVLMSKRRKQDYVAVLEKVLEILPEAPMVEGFMLDFEVGLWQALRHLFPGSQLKGCAFHWTQAVMRKVGEVGLKSTYMQIQGAHQLIKKLLALPFLPGPHIGRAFEKLKQRIPESLPFVTLFDYVNDTWITNSVWSMEEWSIYKQVVRTNNDVEGWHRSLNRSGGRAAMSFYALLVVLLQEAKMSALNTQEVHSKIMEAWSRYDERDITCEDFLALVGGIYL